MIDSTSNENGTNGLATALKDRANCTIPIQPNHSLPVRPAPHTPCRSAISKKIMKKKKNSDETQNEISVNNTKYTEIIPTTSSVRLSTSDIDSLQTISSSSPSSSSSSSSSLTSSSPLPSPSSPSSSSSLLAQTKNYNCIVNNETNMINNRKIKEKMSNIEERLDTKKQMHEDTIDAGNFNNNIYDKKNNFNFIDITKSPDKHNEFSISMSETVLPNTFNEETVILNDDDNYDDDNCTSQKKRRRKKDKRSVNNNVSAFKIVPPLKLKKIQCLQTNDSTEYTTQNWSYVKTSMNVNNVEEPKTDIGFQYYHSCLSPKTRNNQDNANTSDEWPNKYRIVSNPISPCTVDINDHSTIILSNNEERLRYRQHKLQVKLCELKKKTVELSEAMLKTAFKSQNNSIQETIDSYEKQIETLKNLLTEFPENGKKNYITIQIPKSDAPIKTPPLSLPTSPITHTLTSAYCNSSRSSDSPNSSSKVTNATITVKNPCEIEDGISILPKINLTSDNDYFHLNTEEQSLIPNTESSSEISYSKDIKKAIESFINDEIYIEDKPDIFQSKLNDKIISDINLNNVSHDNTINGEKIDNKTEKIDDNTISPSVNINEKILTIDITNNVNNNFLNENEQMTSSKISSSCGTMQHSYANQSIINTDSNFIIPRTKDNTVSNEFPSLGSWLVDTYNSRNSNKSTNINYQQQDVIKSISKQNQMPVIQHTSNEQVNQNHEFNTPSDVSQNSKVLEEKSNTTNVKWNNEQWHGQTYRQPYISQNFNGQNTNISMAPNPICLPDRYTKSYPINSCRSYNYNYPVIAAPPNTITAPLRASLWNNTIINYPFIRPRNIVNTELPNIKSSSNIPMQHDVPMTTTNQVPLQQTASSYHCISPSKTSSDGGVKRRSTRDSVNLKLPLTNISKRYEFPPATPILEPFMLPESSNSAGIRRLTQGEQEDYYHYYGHHSAILQRQPLLQQSQQSIQYNTRFPGPASHLPIHNPSMSQVNYGSPWRGPISSTVPLISSRNYRLHNNWSLDPCNLLSSLSPVARENYPTSLNMAMPIGIRNVKEHAVDPLRNCETPHLGKVKYNSNSSKTLKCSNCGEFNPTFKCLGCEMTFYCDELCQTRHWGRHVVGCPKKMPKLKKVVS